MSRRSRASESSTLTVGFPLYDDCTLLDFAGATQVFAPFAGGGFEPVWLAKEKKPIPTTEGVEVLPHATLAETEAVDILFVPGGGSKVEAVMADEEFLDELRRLAKEEEGEEKWVGSVCTGAFIVAAAGLFDGLEATTYWSQLENLAGFPRVTVHQNYYPRALIDVERRRFSGGGVSSSIDLALYLVEAIRGPEIAETVQLSIQYAPGPPYHSGSPAEAPPAITESLLENQKPFLEDMRRAVEKAVGGEA